MALKTMSRMSTTTKDHHTISVFLSDCSLMAKYFCRCINLYGIRNQIVKACCHFCAEFHQENNYILVPLNNADINGSRFSINLIKDLTKMKIKDCLYDLPRLDTFVK